MARARNIKPALFANDILAELDPIERLAFIGLWTIVDFRGCAEYRPKKIKALILPYDNCDMDKILINLDNSGFILTYTFNGQKYLKVTNFEKHQNPHKNEREKGSDIPDYADSKGLESDSSLIEINPDKDGTNRADSLSLIPDSLKLIPEKPKAEKIPYSAIAESYNELFAIPTGNPEVRANELSIKRKTAIKKLWNLSSDSKSIDWFKKYFTHCASVPNMQSDVERSKGWENWRPSFDYLVRQDTLDKAREDRL